MTGKRCVIPAERQVVVESFQLEDREPGEHEILIETRYSLVSPGTETAIYSALDPDVRRKGGWCSYPWAAGYTAVGQVLKAGRTRFGYKPGDWVMAQAPHASHAWIHTRERITAPVSPDMDLRGAPYLRLAAISKTALDVSSCKAGEGALVVGLGTIGNLAAQIFREHGARVAGLDPSPRRRELAAKSGIGPVFDPSPGDGLMDRVSEALGARPRIIVEAVGDAALSYACLQHASPVPDGEIILLGSPRKSTPMDARDIFSLIHRQGLRVIGAHEGVLDKGGMWGDRPRVDANLKALTPLIREGRIQVEPLLSHVLYPAQLKEGYEGLLEKKEEYIGVMLDWSKY